MADGSVVAEHDFDPQDLVTLLGNLIDNAMDATMESDRDRRVEVFCDLRGQRLRLRVGDSGPGLTPAQRAQVFTRGWSTKPGVDGIGRGIGLALVTGWCAASRAASTSRSPAGAAPSSSWTSPRMPRRRPTCWRPDQPDRAAVGRSGMSTAAGSLSALVVEDEAVVAEANAMYLERLGLSVVGVARSGRDALRRLSDQPDIDLVVLDMNLPDGHGLTCCAASVPPGTART